MSILTVYKRFEILTRFQKETYNLREQVNGQNWQYIHTRRVYYSNWCDDKLFTIAEGLVARRGSAIEGVLATALAMRKMCNAYVSQVHSTLDSRRI